jgi:hypothetical protein
MKPRPGPHVRLPLIAGSTQDAAAGWTGELRGNGFIFFGVSSHQHTVLWGNGRGPWGTETLMAAGIFQELFCFIESYIIKPKAFAGLSFFCVGLWRTASLLVQFSYQRVSGEFLPLPG